MHTLILGLDAFDPKIFERLSAEGRLPHLTRYAGAGGYARFEVANPPQSEVSWTSIATGLNPGGHGIFDFVHRDPGTYTPYPSLLPTSQGLLGTQFVPPTTAPTIFEEATRQGFPATVLWWPATFPARPELPVRTLPGLGTPDILGRLGVGTFFCSDPASCPAGGKIPVVPLEPAGREHWRGALAGPMAKGLRGTRPSSLPLELTLDADGPARLSLGETKVDLQQGAWSSILEVTFATGAGVKLSALTRAILTHTRPNVRLYLLPLQIHPLHSPWRYATPASFAAEIWREHGPFLTLGMPQDTVALEEGYITDEQFLALCDSIHDVRRSILLGQISTFREGILASVFDCLDRIQHVFWSSRPDVVEAWYVKLDALVGEVGARLSGLGLDKVKLLIVSDHGISNYQYKVHLNRWLIDRGYLVTHSRTATGDLKDVDWPRSEAYALGLNSLYINLAGREGQGSVAHDDCVPLKQRLQDQLQSLRAPDRGYLVKKVWRNDEAFAGPLATHGPDLVIGFAPGSRASPETGLGKWGASLVEYNADRWRSDHCIDYREVPGVLFANLDLRGLAHPSYRDIPELSIGMAPA